MVYWVDNQTAVAVRPKKDLVHSEVVRWFNDQLGVAPTIPRAEWFNMIQSELLSIATALGITPDKFDDGQIGQALLEFIDHQPLSNGYSATRKYQSGDIVKIDGVYYEAYNPDGCLGKDPRDPANRPSGWTNQDINAPYHWVEIGRSLMLPEIGSPIYLMNNAPREGLIKLRNDGQLSATKFWRVAELNPNIVSNGLITLADVRANVIRALDDGKGVDVGRVINSYQEDAMLKISGSIDGVQHKGRSSTTGSLYTKSTNITPGVNQDMTNGNAIFEHLIDSSREYPTKTSIEIRMKNIAMLCAIRI